MNHLTRRGAMAAAGASALAAAVSPSAGAVQGLDPIVAAWCAAAGGEGAYAIGERCLALGLVASDVGELVDHLESATRPSGRARDPATLRAALRQALPGDFRAGRIVRVDGWVLSATETRFYALSALVGRAR